MNKLGYRYNFKLLEKDLETAYRCFCLDNSSSTRTDLYHRIKEISFAILSVGSKWSKYNIDYDTISYKYSLYLLERMITKRFRPKYTSDHFPWVNYINKNILHVVNTCREDNLWHELVKDLEFLVDQNACVFDKVSEDGGNQEDYIAEKQLAATLYKSLRIFYSDKEIRRILPIAIDIVSSDGCTAIHKGLNKDLKDFTVVLISLAKRIISENSVSRFYEVSKTDFKKAMSSSVRSSLFLSSVANSNIFPKELLLSLDYDSLYRIVQVAGGKCIRIPNQGELDSLMGAVLSVSNRILEGKKIDDSISTAKRDLDLVFSKQIDIQSFVTKMVDTIEIHGEDKSSEPLIELLSKSLKDVKNILDQYMKVKIADNSKKTFGDIYKKVETSLSL